MKWQSNAKYGVKDLSSGSIFTLQGYDCRVTIHKLHGCGDGFYLSCNELGFNQYELLTEDFPQAVMRAKALMREKVKQLHKIVSALECDNEIEFTRY